MAANAAPEVSGEVLFYKQPEPLSIEKHRGLGIKQVPYPYAFLVGTHIVPIAVQEFALAAASYPIIFAGEAKVPLAVFGLQQGENLFVSPEGLVDPEIYLPAFVRRYPFVFASDSNAERMVVCIDRAAPMVGERPEVPFFEGNEPSKFTQEAIEFCTEFEGYRQSTQVFIQRITEADLWQTKRISVAMPDENGQPGETQNIAEYFAISEEKLQALSPAQFEILRKDGCIAGIYGHLISQLLWPKLLNRSAANQAYERMSNVTVAEARGALNKLNPRT